MNYALAARTRTGVTKVADEEALPFKTAFVLSHEMQLRLLISPESTHSQWNDVKSGIRRTGLQHCLLLASVLANSSHGPFSSGKNSFTMREAAEGLAATISPEAFNDLCDLMHEDRCDSQDDAFPADLPTAPADIPQLRALTTLPTYV